MSARAARGNLVALSHGKCWKDPCSLMRQGLGGSIFLMSSSGPENVHDRGYLLSKLQHGDSSSTQASLMAYPRPLCRSIDGRACKEYFDDLFLMSVRNLAEAECGTLSRWCGIQTYVGLLATWSIVSVGAQPLSRNASAPGMVTSRTATTGCVPGQMWLRPRPVPYPHWAVVARDSRVDQPVGAKRESDL